MTRARTLADIGDLTIGSDVAIDSNGGFLFDVSDKALEFGDNYKVVFGAGGDLEIYHDASDSIIADVGTGNLQIRADDFYVMKQDGSKVMIRADTDSFVKLYHNNTERLATTSVGIGVDQVFGLSDTDTGIALGANGANIMQFYTGNSERVQIDASGNTIFSGLIKAADGSESAPSIVFNNDTNTGIYRKGGDKLGFVTGGVERMRITDLGRIEFEVPTNQSGGLQDQRLDWRNENNAGIMASIAVHREQDANAPAALVFRTSTNVDSASNSSDGEISEKMRIDSVGRVMIGATNASSYSTGGLMAAHSGGSSNSPVQVVNGTGSGTRRMIDFFVGTGTARVGSIQSNDSATAFNTSSDYRLKENLNYTWDATARLKQLKPVQFNWISDDTNTVMDGFLAHEVSDVVPFAISGEKDELWTDGSPMYQQIDQSKLVPLLVKTIQELEARIAALEAGE